MFDQLRNHSDVDVLVEFNAAASYTRCMGLKFRLEDLLQRRIDLVTTKGSDWNLDRQLSRKLFLSRDWRVYLSDMIDLCIRVLCYMHALSREHLDKPGISHDATLRKSNCSVSPLVISLNESVKKRPALIGAG